MKKLSLEVLLFALEEFNQEHGPIVFGGVLDWNEPGGLEWCRALLEAINNQIKKPKGPKNGARAASGRLGGLAKASKRSKTKQKLANVAKGSSEPLANSSLLRNAFCLSFEWEFKRPYPGWGKKENSMASNLLKSLSIEKAVELAALYPKWNDPWVTKVGHPFEVFVKQYAQLDAWAYSHDLLIDKIAKGRVVETVDIKKAIEKEQSAYGFKRKLAELRAQEAEDQNDSREIHRELPSQAPGRLCGQPGDPFGQSVFDPGSEDPNEQGSRETGPLPVH